MKILIKITQQILERSKMCQKEEAGSNCAIALAIRDLFPNAFVSNQAIYTEGRDQDDKYGIRLPEYAKIFIGMFDILTPEERLKMSEFSFEIDVPYSVIDNIGISQVYKVLSESRTLEHVN